MMLVFAVVAFLSFLSGADAGKLLVLQSYSSNTAGPTCTQSAFLETVYEFSKPTWCQNTPTSNYNYEFAVLNGTYAQFTAFGSNDVNCTKPIAKQTQKTGECFKLFGDNPVMSYQVTFVDGGCPASNCGSSGTCCWTPQGDACVDAADACCCPDFQNACPSGSSCLCQGECPGPNCQCSQCFPGNAGLCVNK